jgi:hypothetical protein
MILANQIFYNPIWASVNQNAPVATILTGPGRKGFSGE